MEAGVAARAGPNARAPWRDCSMRNRTRSRSPAAIRPAGARPSRRSPRPIPGAPATASWCRHEWGGNLACMRLIAERAGARVETIPSDQDGCVDPEALRAMLDERVRLIALTWLPANGGLINPAAAIGAVARTRHRLFRGRGPGRGPIAHRRGAGRLRRAGRRRTQGAARPRGTGLLYVRRFPAQADAGLGRHPQCAARSRRRAHATGRGAAGIGGSLAGAARGLANALREALDIGLDAIRARVDAIARACAPNWPRCPASRCWTKAASDRGWCRSMWRPGRAGSAARAGGARRDHRRQRRELHAAGHDGARAGADRAGLGRYLTTQDEIGRLLGAAPVAAPGLRRLRPPPGARRAST